MKNAILILALFIGGLITTSCERIDAGHVGVRVNLYGDGKGVHDVTEITGMVWYNPFSTSIYEIATYVQNVEYKKNSEDGNTEFRITTKDGLTVSFDVAMNYRTLAEDVISIFKKYRKPPYELENSVIRNYTRDAFNTIASNYTAEGLYEERANFVIESAKAVSLKLEKEGFTIENITILNELRLPNSVAENIEKKVQAKQLALQKEQEVLQKKYDADKEIEEARGKAEAMRIKADGEAYAYDKKQQTLTPILIQQQWIEKWNGGLPNYYSGGSNMPFIIGGK